MKQHISSDEGKTVRLNIFVVANICIAARRYSTKLQAQPSIEPPSINFPFIEPSIEPLIEPPSINSPFIKPPIEPLSLKRPYALSPKESINQQLLALKKYRPEAISELVIQWVESESYQERHCRPDSFTKLAPNTTDRKERFVVPPILAQLVSPASISSRSSEMRLVEDPFYRNRNLAANNIYFRYRSQQYPEHISSLVDCISKGRDSPDLSPDQVMQDRGTGELSVEGYFKDKIFPCSTGALLRTDRLPMIKSTVPEVGSDLKISGPVPDMLYGYDAYEAFPQQKVQLISMRTEIIANNDSLHYPFLIVEFKADGPSGCGSLWVAANQCAGGSVSCVNIAERLNGRLKQCKSNTLQLINSAAFSIAMNGTEARLYISWKDNDLNYYIATVSTFCFQDPENYLRFHRYVQNIIDWGKDKRLQGICDSLNHLLEDGRLKTPEAVKSRPPISDDSGSDSGDKRKVSRKSWV